MRLYIDTNVGRVVLFQVSDDAWHQYAMTFDGSKVTFYVDGALQQQKDLGGKI